MSLRCSSQCSYRTEILHFPYVVDNTHPFRYILDANNPPPDLPNHSSYSDRHIPDSKMSLTHIDAMRCKASLTFLRDRLTNLAMNRRAGCRTSQPMWLHRIPNDYAGRPSVRLTSLTSRSKCIKRSKAQSTIDIAPSESRSSPNTHGRDCQD